MQHINNDIQEQRVGFPNAKLLKEKGFGVPCTHYFILNFSSFKADLVPHQFKTPIEDNKNIVQLCVTKQPHLALAPTQQLAIDWIFLNFGIHISVRVIKWDYEKDTLKFNYTTCKLNPNNPSDVINESYNFDTTEEAKEAAINHVLTKMICKK